MITRRRRTEVLVESGPALARELAARIEEAATPVEVVPPRQGLVMNQVRETARNSRFYLGEALMSECRVRIGDTEGLGAVLGGDGAWARDLAIVDAAFSAPELSGLSGELEGCLLQAERALAVARGREAQMTMASRVSFDTMSGQDMSVQAVMK